MNQKLALNTAAIRQAPFDHVIGIAQRAGYDGIGLWATDVSAYLERGGSYGALRERLAANGLSVPELCFAGGWMYVAEDERKLALAKARALSRMARQLDAGCLVAVPSFQHGDLDDAVRDFRELCDVAAEESVRVALEFNGVAKQVRSLAVGLDVVDQANRPNGGLLVDSFHFFVGGSSLPDIDRIPLNRLFLVHLSDAAHLPLEQFTTSHRHRFFPGHGIANVRQTVERLQRLGYQGFFSLEFFNDEYLPRNPYRVAMEGLAAMRGILRPRTEPTTPRQEYQAASPSSGADQEQLVQLITRKVMERLAGFPAER